MNDRAFVDTNILVYAHDRGSGAKHERALKLVESLWVSRSGVISTQVLQEFYVNVRRKARAPISSGEATRLVEDYLAWEVVVNDGNSVLEAIGLEERHGLSFWDSLIVQAATRAGVGTIFSEDLNPGQWFGLVRVLNPLT